MRPMYLPAVAAVAAALAIGLAPRDGGATEFTGVYLAQQQSFGESELKRYALAILEVQRIREEYIPKLEAADSTEQRTAIRSKANDEMVRAVNNIGLSVDTYNRIYEATQADPTLAKKVSAYIQAVQQ